MKHDIMTVHEVAELTGITIRTLHYYDEIGLLKSSEVSEAKYRWKDYISENFFHCSNEALCNLGDLYQMDNRFAVNINRFGNGDLSAFFNKAIKNYCSKVVQKLNSNPNT